MIILKVLRVTPVRITGADEIFEIEVLIGTEGRWCGGDRPTFERFQCEFRETIEFFRVTESACDICDVCHGALPSIYTCVNDGQHLVVRYSLCGGLDLNFECVIRCYETGLVEN